MIKQDEAIEIARKRAAEKDWAFDDPVNVVTRESWSGEVTRYEIVTNRGKLGSKARFTIDAKTGDIVSEGYIPR